MIALNKEDRIRAFALRCDGASWDEIGKALHYTGTNVAQDIQCVVSRGGRVPKIIYPEIKRYIIDNCGGSIEKFAASIHSSASTIRPILVHGEEPGRHVRKKIYDATGFLIPLPEADEEE